MELAEMKSLWEEMTRQQQEQKLLNDKIIMEMTQLKFKDKLKGISFPETIGAIICFIIFIIIAAHLGEMDTWYLQVSGWFTAAFYLIIPTLSLRSIYRMQHLDLNNYNYTELLQEFHNRRSHFLFIQKLAIYLSFLLILFSLPVAAKILTDKDILLESKIWMYYIPIMTIFFFFFARWGYRCYANASAGAGKTLEELEMNGS